ncbi:hypothetical protein G5V59_21470 [Nocardioides sp. W3-2-3]|uniref:hypothetical protein n=1 Tax=Nocardioides convexus TaxID=2712224 RepID=UPI002418276E|nr:hypothetical protein [Nocardioides convexus]NHA01500.1 hypothetical protein [Nocardioides convexus]
MGLPDGYDVKALRERLRTLGYSAPARADGVWNAGTDLVSRLGDGSLTPEPGSGAGRRGRPRALRLRPGGLPRPAGEGRARGPGRRGGPHRGRRRRPAECAAAGRRPGLHRAWR